MRVLLSAISVSTASPVGGKTHTYTLCTESVLDTWKYHGFPVVRDDEILLGYVPREKLKSFIGEYLILSLQSPMRLSLASFTEPFLSESGAATGIGSFSGAQGSDSADLSPLLEDAMQLRKEVPLELVVNMFRKLVSEDLYA
jgi:chloride channel 3/4/5